MQLICHVRLLYPYLYLHSFVYMYVKGGCASARCRAGKVITKWDFKPAAASCAYDIVGVAQRLERSSSERHVSQTKKMCDCNI